MPETSIWLIPEDVHKTIVHAITDRFGFSKVLSYELDKSGKVWAKYGKGINLEESFYYHGQVPPEGEVFDLAIKQKKHQVVLNPYEDPRCYHYKIKLHNGNPFAVVPIMIDDSIIIISVSDEKSPTLFEEDSIQKIINLSWDVLSPAFITETEKTPDIKRNLINLDKDEENLPKEKDNDDYTMKTIQKRTEWLETRFGINLKNILHSPCDPLQFKGNIENLIGICQIPIGIAGPLKVNGEHAKGDFFVPMATTEGVLVSSFAVGMRVLTKAGGVDVKITKDEMHISPLFIINDLKDSLSFIQWVNDNFQAIKTVAELTTEHGVLINIEGILYGSGVILRFIYNTKDAMGMNMINWATQKACAYISKETNFSKYYVRSNFSSDKKISSYNIHKGYGKEVFASLTVKKEYLRMLRVTPEKMFDFYINSISATVRANMMGFNGQVANGIAAIFLACGQDIAHVLHSSLGTSSISITKNNDLYISIHIPNLLVGTVGGGTALPTQKECLDILGCYGDGKSKKFAEIIAAAVLAGELAICASLVNGSFFEAHEKMGRNKPGQ